MINRRDFLKIAPAAAAMRSAGAAPGRPNVIVILADDQGYGDLSCHGHPVLKTPNLDRLHGESVRFTDFHSAPMCTPTRGQLLSGLDALRNRATSVTAGRALLRRDVSTLADRFGVAGYATGIFGKWHLGDNYPYRPMDRGFQEAAYHLGFGMSSAPEFENDYFDGRYLHNGVPKRFRGYCTDWWFGRAMTWMEERSAAHRPFVCYLPTNTPHTPQWVADEFSQPYRRPKLPADYYGMIANLDMNFGRLEKFLAASGLKENTIVVYLSDNGGTAGVPVFNAGMRGRKSQLYEGGHRVPCFVRWPGGRLRAPGDVDVPAQMQDLLPTLLELCGVPAVASALDGRSLAGPLRGGGALADRMLVVQYGQVLKKWDACVIWNKWRLISGTELYDLRTDPGQKQDVAAANADVVLRMRGHYERWWSDVHPAIDDFCPISIGAPQADPVALTSSDWESVYADNPVHVLTAAGGPRGGPWNVQVERDGEYEIAVSRWPPGLRIPLDAAMPAQKRVKGSLPEGAALAIAAARLTIAGQDRTEKARPGASEVVFRVPLRRGPKTKLHAWFQDAGGKDLCGAFYANVKLL